MDMTHFLYQNSFLHKIIDVILTEDNRILIIIDIYVQGQ
jgi:hypothetical protein